ncbi:ShlB/FhaC/HecB family hemolysin secretion/activation protein [Phenylobacterium sp.]|uniref:ShlB/FhaC/HecB family hemolysin secretion/activation protein n=1 Tax=Phenylobacterium sp. TaxID=1871053 RepID=UPI002C0931C8|nr:ShlB/FhaC/HecB family hemolysin secretion/activation protein [Phenylobacterium sp.]HLZ73662.1 ShlB/FhaC/HecB family hemolysin secretion/activation protein [Phenylobacterium sp.]
MRALRVGLGTRTVLAFAATALTGSGAAWAQTAPGGAPPGTIPPSAAATGLSAPELNPAARVPRLQPRDTDIFQPEPPGPCPLADSDVSVTLGAVTFRGSTALKAEDFGPTYREFIGKPQKVGVICQIRDRAAQTLFDRGILARVEIPEQRIAGGALILDVIEAHVVNVRVRGDIGPAQAAVERYVEKLRGMKPFDMKKAQRYLLLASDIPGVRVRAAIKPSVSPERGAVDIDVTVSRTAFSAVGNAQNMGSKTVGRWGGLVRGDARSFTPLGEDTTLVAFHTLDSNEQWVVQLQEAARIGADGLMVHASAVYGESRPGDVLKPLDLKTTSAVGNVELSYPLIRRRRLNLNIAGGLDVINQETDQGEGQVGGGALTKDNVRVAYLRADGDMRAYGFDRNFLLDGSLTLRKGLTGLGATRQGADLATREFAAPDAFLVRATAGVSAPVAGPISASLRAQAQYSDKALTPYEQISLGDLSVGRGYDPAVVLGDTGAAAALDLRYAFVQLYPQILASPFVFYDQGFVHNNEAGLSGLTPSRTLRSFGAGVTLRLANRANLELTYAKPIDAVTAGGPRPAGRLLVNLTASFF